MGGTINLPTRQRLIANLLLVKMGAFHRMLNTESWVRRLDDAERALDGEWASTLGEPSLYDPLNPAPTRIELLLWRPEAEAAFQLAGKLNRGLTTDSKWVRYYPEVVAFSYEIVQRAKDVLTHIDQLMLELDIMQAYKDAGPDQPTTTDHDERLGTGSRLARRPSTAPGRRQHKGKHRSGHDDAVRAIPGSKTIN